MSPRVEWDAEDRHLGVVDLVHVLDERTLQECSAFPREVRQLAADERGDPAVVDGGRGLEAEAQAALDLLALAAFRNARLGLLSPGALGVGQCGIGAVGHGCSSRAVLSHAGYDATRPGSLEMVGWLLVLILAAIATPPPVIATWR
jgi:hypothetical protein